MSHPLRGSWVLEDFLVWEAHHPDRYEFIDGIIRMMVGGTLAHNTIGLNLATVLHTEFPDLRLEQSR
ncbi:MAG: Uma2 family endonuclease [Gammaproteobacteria bacterium]|nr:Uma2 family endonuclease [Gammaproteobacteria bacterium]